MLLKSGAIFAKEKAGSRRTRRVKQGEKSRGETRSIFNIPKTPVTNSDGGHYLQYFLIIFCAIKVSNKGRVSAVYCFLGPSRFCGIIVNMQKNFTIPPKKDLRDQLKLWGLPCAILLLSLLVLPAYVDAMNVQLLDNELLSSLCGFIGWGAGAN